MTSSTPAQAIAARLVANWPTTPIYMGDDLFEAPQPPTPFVVLEFPGGTAMQYSIGDPGNNVWKEDGAFMLHVMVPRNGWPHDGTGRPSRDVARDYADTLAAIFRGQVFATSLICYAPYPPHESERADGNYFALSFATPYCYQYLA